MKILLYLVVMFYCLGSILVRFAIMTGNDKANELLLYIFQTKELDRATGGGLRVPFRRLKYDVAGWFQV